MDKTMKNHCLLLLASLLLLTGCKEDEEADRTQERNMYVASRRIYLNLPAGGPALHYLTRFEPGEQWGHILSIHDFQYEPGYEYLLRVRITDQTPEPGVVVDGDPTRYDCMEVLYRVRKTSDGLPADAVEE